VPLRDPGGGRRSAALTLGAAVVVVAVAIAIPGMLGGQADPAPSAVSRPSPAPATAPTAPRTPVPTLPLPAAVYSARQLVQAVRAGELDGRLVLVRGSLETIVFPCDREPHPLRTCVMLAIEGVDLPVTAGRLSLPWHDDPPAGDYLVVVPDAGRLVYVGHIAPGRPWPTAIDLLTAAVERDDPGGVPSELFLVDGWLVLDPPSSCRASPSPGASPCREPGPFLADERPVPGASPSDLEGSRVIVDVAMGIDPAAEVAEGPFLVAMLSAGQCATRMFEDACAGTATRWVVAAVYDDTVAWVHVP
jgi:hypothetical protein